MPTEIKKIRKILKLVRKELIDIAPHLNHNGDSGRNHVAKHLGGWCQYGSWLVWEALKNAGYEVQIVAGHGHWFNKCGEYLCDVTATQFGQNAIVCRKWETVQNDIAQEEKQMNWWKPANKTSVFDSPCDANMCNLKGIIKNARQRFAGFSESTTCRRCGEDGEENAA